MLGDKCAYCVHCKQAGQACLIDITERLFGVNIGIVSSPVATMIVENGAWSRKLSVAAWMLASLVTSIVRSHLELLRERDSPVTAIPPASKYS